MRMLANWYLHLLARSLPGSINLKPSLRPFLHRLRGVKIYGCVFIGDDVYIDEDYPGAVEIHDGAVIAARCTIIGHTKGPGRIVIQKQAAIGAGCVIVCASGQTLTIGEGAVISAGSTVSHDIPPHTLCGAPRIQAFGTVSVPFTMETSYEDFRRGVRPLRRTDATNAETYKEKINAFIDETRT
jgi:serine acetyltransferase